MGNLLINIGLQIIIKNQHSIIQFLEREARRSDNSLDDYAVRVLKKYLEEK